MDGWGSLTMLIKRQEADKFRKAELRARLKSQKESYLHGHEHKDEFDFPEISPPEMKKLKERIRKDLKKQRIKSIIISSIILSIIITYIVYLYLRIRKL